MNIIKKTFSYFGAIIFLIILFFSLVYLASISLKFINEDYYSQLRDKIRVFRTENFRESQKYRFKELHPYFENYDVKSIIRVKDNKNAIIARKKILKIIWNNPEERNSIFPNKIIKTDLSNSKNYNFNKIKNLLHSLKEVKELRYISPRGFVSKSMHFIPKSSNSSLVIFHGGNTGSFFKHIKTINFFLNEGFEVIAYSMWIIDEQPEITINSIGAIKFRDHSFLKFLDEPLRVYFDPLIAGINYLTSKKHYNNIIAVGFSGGGWVVTVLSAFDQRVNLSYPIAGTYPIYLRRFRNWSTWQESYPPLLDAANYLDLYIMSAQGIGRRQVQVLNKYDACCYSGIGWVTYANIVKDISKKLDGNNWEIFVDDSHADHKISKKTLNFILQDINKYKFKSK